MEYKKVTKTSLGAEQKVSIKQFDYTQDVIKYAKENNFEIIAAEITTKAIRLSEYSNKIKSDQNLAVIFGNEVDGVLRSTLEDVDYTVYVPMK